MSVNITIGFAEEGDVEALWRLYKQLAPTLTSKPKDMADSLARLSVNPLNGGIIVLRLDRVVVATCQLVLFDNLVRAPRKRALIESIVVDEPYRRRGIAANMLSWVLDFLRTSGCSHVEIGSSFQREGAHVLYKKLGFTEFGKAFLLKFIDDPNWVR